MQAQPVHQPHVKLHMAVGIHPLVFALMVAHSPVRLITKLVTAILMGVTPCSQPIVDKSKLTLITPVCPVMVITLPCID